MFPQCMLHRAHRVSIQQTTSAVIVHIMRLGRRWFGDIRDGPLDFWGGGGLELLLLANFLFTSERKQSFFLAINVQQFFFYVSSKNFFVVRFPYYIRYHLVFHLVNIFFINFDNNLFFLPTFSTNFFFWLLWRQTIFFQFFSSPPPPIYQMVRP